MQHVSFCSGSEQAPLSYRLKGKADNFVNVTLPYSIHDLVSIRTRMQHLLTRICNHKCQKHSNALDQKPQYCKEMGIFYTQRYIISRLDTYEQLANNSDTNCTPYAYLASSDLLTYLTYLTFLALRQVHKACPLWSAPPSPPSISGRMYTRYISAYRGFFT